MKLAFDHLVWFTKRPEEVIVPLNQKGIYAVNGGRHENWGTYNSLIYFGLSYIEFLGIENMSIAQQEKENRLVTHIVEQLPKENGNGPARIAIRTHQMKELEAKLKEEGLTVYGPFPGERISPDGEMISWSLLFPENSPHELSLPFFIQWETADEERYSKLVEQKFIGSHINGSPKFESAGFVVHNLEQTIAKWSKLFGMKQGEEFFDSALNAKCRKLELDGTNLLFCTPLGEGPAQKALTEKGETPFLVQLTETGQKGLFELENGCISFL